LLRLARKAYLNHEACTLCKGIGWVRLNGTLQECPCIVVARDSAEYRSLSTVAEPETRLSFDGLHSWSSSVQWDTLARAMGSLKLLTKSPDCHQWVTLMGAAGTGKSHLLLAAYNCIPDVSIYILTPILSDRFHDALRNNRDERIEYGGRFLSVSMLKDILAEVPVLFLDDLGLEHDSPYVKSMITDIVVRRYQGSSERPTIVATNLDRCELLSRYPRLGDRILDVNLALVHGLTLGSYRQHRPGVTTAPKIIHNP